MFVRKDRNQFTECLEKSITYNFYNSMVDCIKNLLQINQYRASYQTMVIVYIGQQFNASVKEPFLYIGFNIAILQESGNFTEVIARLHKSMIGLGKTFAPSFKN